MLRTPPSAAGRRRAGRARFPYAARGFGGRSSSPAGHRPAARADPAQPAVRTIDREFVTSAKKFANFNEFSEIKKIRKNS